jgi:hypothetical protein
MGMATSNSTRPRKKAVFWWISGIALFLLLGLGGCIALISKSFQSVDGGKVVAGQFLDRVVQHDFEMAHSMLDPDAKKVTSQEMLADLVQLVEKHNGKLTGHSDPKGIYIFAQKGRSGARFSYSITTEKGSTSGNVTVARTAGGWSVLSFNLKP